MLEYYASTVRVKIKALFPGNPKDKTTIINGTIFVSKDDKAVSLLLQKEIAQKFISVQNSQKEIIEKLDALISKKISM